MTRPPPSSTLFPYTTLFRSAPIADDAFQVTDKYLGRVCVVRKGRYLAGYGNLADGRLRIAWRGREAGSGTKPNRTEAFSFDWREVESKGFHHGTKPKWVAWRLGGWADRGPRKRAVAAPREMRNKAIFGSCPKRIRTPVHSVRCRSGAKCVSG